MNAAKATAACLVGMFSFLFGMLDQALITLLLCLVVDYIFGLAKAIKKRKFDPEVGVWGIGRKIGILFVVAIAVQIDALTNAGGAVRILAIYAYIGNEIVSILKNMTAVGVPIPEKIAKYFLEFAGDPEEPKRKRG